MDFLVGLFILRAVNDFQVQILKEHLVQKWCPSSAPWWNRQAASVTVDIRHFIKLIVNFDFETYF
jgi:hypothetical protein